MIDLNLNPVYQVATNEMPSIQCCDCGARGFILHHAPVPEISVAECIVCSKKSAIKIVYHKNSPAMESLHRYIDEDRMAAIDKLRELGLR